MASDGDSIRELLHRLLRWPRRTRPNGEASTFAQLHEKPVTLGELVAAASLLDFGGLPVDALMRNRDDRPPPSSPG